jgi:dolichol-phosphate mannosyltransferase
MIKNAAYNLSKLYVIIPVFNESANVSQLCRTLNNLGNKLEKDFSFQCIIVDDGSRDDTVDQFISGDLHYLADILRHEFNRGPGAAFSTAFAHLSGKIGDEDWLLTMEGDNTSQIDLLRRMIAFCKQGVDVILASPYAPGGKMIHVAWHRLFLSHTANMLARWILGLGRIHTISSFCRLHNGRIIKKLQQKYGVSIVDSMGFEWAVEMLAKLVKMNARIIEVPMQLDFSARKGKPKMRIVRTIRGYFRLFAQLKS